MSKTWSVRQRFLMALVLIGGCLYPKNALSQSGGTCVVNTQQIIFTCYSGCTKSGCACSSTTTLTEPMGSYGTGVLYQTATTQCCGNTLSYITSPDGQCTVMGAPVRIAASGESRLVFLRECDGRFRLYAIAGERTDWQAPARKAVRRRAAREQGVAVRMVSKGWLGKES
jgi:hypothetical protein